MIKVAILANVPVWTLPDKERFFEAGHYATWLETLIPEFEDVDQEVELHWITMSKVIEKSEVFRSRNQWFHVVPRRSLGIAMLTGHIVEIFKIRRILDEIEPDVLHSWGSEDVYGLAGVFSGMDRRIFSLQGCLTEYLRLIGGSFLFRVQALYEKFTIRRFSYATAESPAAMTLLKEINPQMKVKLVDYGVSPEFSSREWSPSEKPAVLFVGAVTQRKGIQDLIEVAGRKELEGIEFRIAGDGDAKPHLEGISSSNVKWLGKLDRETVGEEMSKAWALVIPTYSDTGPTVVKEARFQGIPVVTTTGAGAKQYIEPSGAGVVVEPGDLDALALAVQEMCESREKCLEIGRRDWDVHRVELHPSETARRLLEYYQEVSEN
ncbi:MAG: glycosyltransferase family 4 protein [Verrucomicrobiaceae bacterium]